MREAKNSSLHFSRCLDIVCHCCKKSLHDFDVDNPDRKRSRADTLDDAREEYNQTNEYCKNDNYTSSAYEVENNCCLFERQIAII